MLKLFLNTVQRQWYDSEGSELADGQPRIPYCNTEKVIVQCCTATPDNGASGFNPDDDWEKDSSFGIAGVTALLSADDNFVRNFKGSLKNELASGAVSSLTVTITGATDGKVPDSGAIRLLDSSGNSESLQYSERSLDGSDVTFTLAPGSTVAKAYPANAETACPEALYMQAAMSTAESDPTTGLFVFNITAYSKKLREKVDYADLKEVDVKGLELLIFTIDGEGIISTCGTFICDTFRIPLPMADPNPNPSLPDTARDGIATIVEALFALGFEVQFSINGTDLWHDDQVDADKFYRFRATAAGQAGDWSAPIALISGGDGKNLTPNAFGTLAERDNYNDESAGFVYGVASESAIYFKMSNETDGSDWSDAFPIIEQSGADGATAYELAVENGFEGTVTEWLEELKGSSAYENAVEEGYGGTKSEWLESLAGEDGKGLEFDATGTQAEKALYDDRLTGFKFAVSVVDNVERKTTLYIYAKQSDAYADWCDTPVVITYFSASSAGVAAIAPVEFAAPEGENKYLFFSLADYPLSHVTNVCIDTDDGELVLPYDSDLGIRKMLKKNGLIYIYFGNNVPEFTAGRVYLSQMIGATEIGEAISTGIMYYGYVQDGEMTNLSEVTADMLSQSSVVEDNAGTLTKQSIGTVPAGAWVIAVVPAGYTASKFDGISGRTPFSEANGGANGTAIEIENKTYKIYGEFKLNTSEIFIYIDPEEV